MGVAVTTCAAWQLCVREGQQVGPAVHALRMLGQCIAMTCSALHWIESAPVPPFPANVAVKTCRTAVWGALEESQIYFMAIVTLAGLLSVGRLRNEQRAESYQGEEFAHCSHHGSS